MTQPSVLDIVDALLSLMAPKAPLLSGSWTCWWFQFAGGSFKYVKVMSLREIPWRRHFSVPTRFCDSALALLDGSSAPAQTYCPLQTFFKNVHFFAFFSVSFCPFIFYAHVCRSWVHTDELGDICSTRKHFLLQIFCASTHSMNKTMAYSECTTLFHADNFRKGVVFL